MLHVAFITIVATFVWQPVGVFADVAAPERANSSENTDNTEGSLNVDERKLIQEGLVWGGFYNGRIDGQFGKDTRDALANAQRQYNQPGTGMLNADLAVRLGDLAVTKRMNCGWVAILEPTSGVKLAYPSMLLTRTTYPESNPAKLVDIDSEDKSVSIEIFRLDDVKPDAMDEMYRFLTSDGKSPVTKSFRKGSLFIIEGHRGTRKYYARYEQRGSKILGYDLVWSGSRDVEMQPISVLISNSFEPLPFDTPRQNRDPDYSHLVELAKAANTDAGGNPSPK
ncbi:hypothetical protein N018_12730 [Pseudomonas syringae CC1557]|uniref:Peptidoglycan binding-like domain-containing protein n=1 Tax=Pseudomonas syringae CC1557 TaxID=1357279 RepID=W0MYD6_PSESX|nr:peptidoglycan-binding domain-containing protein [Pseudomonas syringae]AHG43599.1 hypothetical protein N018_12730 [Pseudomonas syringae CC1557]